MSFLKIFLDLSKWCVVCEYFMLIINMPLEKYSFNFFFIYISIFMLDSIYHHLIHDTPFIKC